MATATFTANMTSNGAAVVGQPIQFLTAPHGQPLVPLGEPVNTDNNGNASAQLPNQTPGSEIDYAASFAGSAGYKAFTTPTETGTIVANVTITVTVATG